MYGCNDINEERHCCGTLSQRKQCCLDAPICTGKRPSHHPRKFGKCQCAAEASWERCSPPRPSRDWANNFSELRRRWSEHAKRQNCPCDDCKRKTIQPLEDSRQICRNEEYLNNDIKDQEYEDEEDPGYRSSSNRGCSRVSRRSSRRHCPHRSPESHSDKSSSRSCTRHEDEKFRGYCLCQPRCCKVKIDARSRPECTCECITTVECPCPPSERRFPKPTKCCVVAESCTKKAVKSKSNCVKLPSKRNSCSTSPGRGIVSLISFAMLILIAVAWTINTILPLIPATRTSRDRSECCRDHSTCLSMVEKVGNGCRGDNSTGHQSHARRQQRATWERTTTTTKGEEERQTIDNRTCSSECRPIVYERGELLIIEDLAGVCDNERPNRQLRKVTSQSSCKQSRRRSRTPPRKQCNFHSCTCTTPTTTAATKKKKKTLNCATQVSRRKLTLAKIAPCDYTDEHRKYSSKEIQVGGRGVDACVGRERQREDAVTNKSSKRLKRTKAKNNLNDTRVEEISKIDLRCTKYITSSADKKRKKAKHCKCPPTCKYYNVSPRKAASDDHQRLLSKSKKSKKTRQKD